MGLARGPSGPLAHELDPSPASRVSINLPHLPVCTQLLKHGGMPRLSSDLYNSGHEMQGSSYRGFFLALSWAGKAPACSGRLVGRVGQETHFSHGLSGMSPGFISVLLEASILDTWKLWGHSCGADLISPSMNGDCSSCWQLFALNQTFMYLPTHSDLFTILPALLTDVK